jgi:hypothetical protein
MGLLAVVLALAASANLWGDDEPTPRAKLEFEPRV